LPVFYQFRALRDHRAILFDTVSLRHYNDAFDSIEARCHRNALAVVTPRCSHQAFDCGLRLTKPGNIDECSTYFEGSHRRVILVLNPCFGAEAFIQEWPAVLWGRRHELIQNSLGLADLVQRGKSHDSRIPNGRDLELMV
jgi:hypothetical protein